MKTKASHSKGLPEKAIEDLFPAIHETSIDLINLRYSQLNHGRIATTPNDLAVLVLIAKYRNAKTLFEFGTNLGLTTYQLAVNTAPEAKIYTIDLDKQQFTKRFAYLYSEYSAQEHAPDEVGLHFKNTAYHPGKIVQLRGSSLDYNFEPYSGKVDYVFIDADHSYDSVRKDTENALKLLANNGIILWHDYITFPDVTQFLSDISEKLAIYHISGTTIAVHFQNGCGL